MSIKENVERGIALLNEKVPGWQERIDWERLDMMEPLPKRYPNPNNNPGCILCQLFGTWYIP